MPVGPGAAMVRVSVVVVAKELEVTPLSQSYFAASCAHARDDGVVRKVAMGCCESAESSVPFLFEDPADVYGMREVVYRQRAERGNSRDPNSGEVSPCCGDLLETRLSPAFHFGKISSNTYSS